MEETKPIGAASRQDEEYKTAIDRFIVEIEKNRAEMAESDQRVEQIRAETRELLAETRHILAKLAAA